jgi:hypothetical protein
MYIQEAKIRVTADFLSETIQTIADIISQCTREIKKGISRPIPQEDIYKHQMVKHLITEFQNILT